MTFTLIIVLVAVFESIIIWWSFQFSGKLKRKVREQDARIKAAEAARIRHEIALQDIKIIEERRYEKQNIITNADDDAIVSILNSLLSNDSGG
jgi:hypothetical protein